MNETAREWFAKAEGDWNTARRELSAVDRPNFDAVCYHAQQCVEKQLKGLMLLDGVVPPRTHNLSLLFERLRPNHPSLEISKVDLEFLSNAGTAFRYPGESADRFDADDALAACNRIREILVSVVRSLSPGATMHPGGDS